MTPSKFDDISSMAQDIVRNLVSQAEAKLASLQDHRAQLRKRIQALNYLTKTFEKNQQTPRPADWPFTPTSAGASNELGANGEKNDDNSRLNLI